MIYIGGFSGGVDSQAAARVMIERYGAENVVLCNTQAGRNEHPLTIAHVAWYSANVHPVTEVVPLMGDFRSAEWCEKKGYDPDTELTFDLLAKIKGRWPSSQAQFCTEALKLAPIRRWSRESFPDGDYERFSGVRRDESDGRASTPDQEWDEYFDCELHHPVAAWTKPECFEFVMQRGEVVNPLYAMGFNRVGCAPCINSGKDDVLNWAQRFPEMIDKIRGWEEFTKRTFFAPCVPGMAINWVDDVVEWAKTSRGGRQTNMFRVLQPSACASKYGLCE